MKVLLLGATGTIGSAILTELLQHGCSVLALARSDYAAQTITAKGAEVLRGDLREPQLWSTAIHRVDAVIHAAATFCEDMVNIDLRVVNELIAQANIKGGITRFIYTGGVWLYGETGDIAATEQSPFKPISSFSWMIENSSLVLNAPSLHTNIIHPAVVYAKEAGVLSSFVPQNGQVEVWGSLDTRWPVVHTDDLASAYRLVLENGRSGMSYNVCGEQAVTVGDIAHSYIRKCRLPAEVLVRSVDEVVAENGAWALGPTLDQCMNADKIKRELGWTPTHQNILSEL
ncbi:NAD-dependent epimerase/dehydratase family protein [Agarivorans sp. 1_MG-2023]|uniref:NAD-dependent epimerase/dehydratase family protein n=1 Tax=Agarivorans sp. 1_MG-2023 TaxID=3062634 RepID=UPI0026E459E7|nr:NAD-dependent epimerase/dehydratase family protein [Agarivorans sp. 1_MG-2023]MDO6765412.1 NAD-dependent epimerase/dehydratase family protein [Agarivorans sp. 1_MG-2023]